MTIDSTDNAEQLAAAPRNDITILATGGSVALAGSLMGRMLNAAGLIVLARLLGAEAFGLYGIGWAIIRIAGTITPMGLHNGVILFGSRYWRTDKGGFKKLLFQSLRLAFFASLVIGCGLVLLAPWLAEHVFRKPDLTSVLRLFAMALPLMTCLTLTSAATRISQRMKFSFYAEYVGQPAANLLLILIFYLIGWRLLGAVTAVVLSFGIALLLALYYVQHLFAEASGGKQRSDSSFRELLAFSLPTVFIGIFAILLIRFDLLFIGYFLPARYVGIYQAASQVTLIFFIIIEAQNAIFSPLIADLYHKGKMKSLEELFRVSTKWGLYLSLPIFFIIFFAAQDVLILVFGQEYASGALPLFILALGMLITVGTGTVGRLLIMTGNQNRWLIIYCVMFMVNVGLNWLLIPRLGLIGAAIATAGAMSGLFFLGLVLVKRILGFWPYDYRYYKVLIAAGLSIVALFLSRFISGDSPVFVVLLTMIVSTSVFGGMLLLLSLDAEDRQFIRLIRVRLGA